LDRPPSHFSTGAYIPRKRRLQLIINIDYEDCKYLTEETSDLYDYAFIPNASEEGGVGFSLDNKSQIDSAMRIIQQAYEKVSV
jgi:hypothetical protein